MWGRLIRIPSHPLTPPSPSPEKHALRHSVSCCRVSAGHVMHSWITASDRGEREHTRSAHSSLPDSERMFINLPSLYQRHAINECYRYVVMRSRCIEAEYAQGGARPTVHGKGFTRELRTSPDKECIKDHNMFDIRVNLTYGDKMRYTVSRNDLGRCQSLIWHPTNPSRIRVGIQPTRRTRRARKRVGMMLERFS